ncbi:hypothetical protein HDU82_007986 [Entophlyctis luteolus]|nr:hypothetical protein HDU82_007986 [Entophlyctis luteolus]
MLLLALLAQPATAAFTASSFSFGASPPQNNVTTICVSGAVPTNQYIGFGIPASATNPQMTGADIVVAFADAAGPQLIHGVGTAGPSFTATPAASVAMDSGMSAYANGLLTLCFTRPAQTVPMGPSGFIWATGAVSNGTVRKHADGDYGTVTNVTLLGQLAASGTASSVSPSGALTGGSAQAGTDTGSGSGSGSVSGDANAACSSSVFSLVVGIIVLMAF